MNKVPPSEKPSKEIEKVLLGTLQGRRIYLRF
jgi:hypothetical protein